MQSAVYLSDVRYTIHTGNRGHNSINTPPHRAQRSTLLCYPRSEIVLLYNHFGLFTKVQRY